ncbi:hypothetical protein HDU76_000721 [Blyttiomyces sp. JEL0837]|nr:hypothetical protein HDU76_000721 [Blyttiomyces sp. JEL0837]
MGRQVHCKHISGKSFAAHQDLPWLGINFTEGLIDYLNANGVSVTFFVIGSQALKYPNVLRYAHESGHQIGIHTFSHPSLISLRDDQIAAEIVYGAKSIKDIINVTPTIFRPPYGEWNQRVLTVAQNLGLRTVLMDRDSRDWDVAQHSEDPAVIAGSFEMWLSQGIRSGISLEHDRFKKTAAAAPNVVNLLLAKNIAPITINQCTNISAYGGFLEEFMDNTTFPVLRWGNITEQLINLLLWSFFVLAMFHSFSNISLYIITLIHVIRNGEKSREADQQPTRIAAIIYSAFYLVFQTLSYAAVFELIDFDQMFVGDPIRTDITKPYFFIFLMMQAAFYCIRTAYVVTCTAIAFINSPSIKAVETSLAAAEESNNLPNLVIIMPIYNEPLPSLMEAVNSITRSKYPLSKINLVMAFDSEEISKVYQGVMYCFAGGDDNPDYGRVSTYRLEKIALDYEKDPITDVEYRGLWISVCRFAHGGKRNAQKCAFEFLRDQYETTSSKPLLLFIDSDIALDKYAIPRLVDSMTRDRFGVKRQAMTGLITCRTKDSLNLWKVFQNTEYIEMQMMHRNAEDLLGALSCLPGALTIMRFETLETIAPMYFGTMDALDPFDFNRCHLGEDRYMTHLILTANERYSVGFCSAARCKTEGCATFTALVKQRRRWYLGTLTNEIYMLTSPDLWKKYTFHSMYVAISAISTGPLFLYVFWLAGITSSANIQSYTAVIAILVSVWCTLIIVAVHLKRLKVIWGYPIVLLLMPFLTLCFQLYGIATFTQRSWGGVRVQHIATSKAAAEKKNAALLAERKETYGRLSAISREILLENSRFSQTMRRSAAVSTASRLNIVQTADATDSGDTYSDEKPLLTTEVE